MTALVGSIVAEYRRYKALGEGALDQLSGEEVCHTPPGSSHSITTIVWHLSGNLESRFTDFLTTDGEKPWRKREEEFASRSVSLTELKEKWQRGWNVLLATLDGLTDEDLMREVMIRGQSLRVHDALHRSLAHTSYHVGQIVWVAKAIRGDQWRYLSIPPGGTAAYNRDPRLDRPGEHSAALADPDRRRPI